MFKRIQQLLRHLAIYGLGDAAPALVSFLLLRVYTNYLTTADYGIIGLLLTIEGVTRVVFRWGTDGAFMRLFYDCRDDEERQRLTSTLLLFLTATNGALLVLGFAATPRIGRYLFEGHDYDGLIRLVIFNTFLTTFHFFPNSLLRIREQSKTFALLTSAKSIATIVVRLLLVVPLRWGVAGVVLADTFVTVAFTIIMAHWILPLLRPVFSRRVLREALRFGLPRVPHALAHQVIAVSDRYLMAAFLTLGDIGLYGVGSSFGQALKMFLNGFEFAWAPFYYGAMDRSDAKSLYSRLGTYLFAAVVLLAAGLSAVATDLVRLMTAPEFHRAAIVIPWTAMGVVAQACYQVAALGLNVTKRTKYLPISTGAAAAFSIGANLLLIPSTGCSARPGQRRVVHGAHADHRVVLLPRVPHSVRMEAAGPGGGGRPRLLRCCQVARAHMAKPAPGPARARKHGRRAVSHPALGDGVPGTHGMAPPHRAEAIPARDHQAPLGGQ